MDRGAHRRRQLSGVIYSKACQSTAIRAFPLLTRYDMEDSVKKLIQTIFMFSIGLILAVPFAGAADRVEAPESCSYCGMDRTQFAQSRMLVGYADGTTVGTCSINCVAIDLGKNADKKVKAFQVADYTTKKLIDARTASWVMGGNVRGVMTSVAKWAFATREDADRFIKEFGGTPATFDEALKAAVEENGGGKGEGAPLAQEGHKPGCDCCCCRNKAQR